MIPRRPRGLLILVVGPSGAGKDSLLRGARAALPAGRFHFARREITRPPGDHEDSTPVSEADFARRAANGAYLLWWRAHGLGYGIPRRCEAHLHAGCAVLANVSRTMLAEARVRLAPMRAVLVTAPPALIAHRLHTRGREDAAAVQGRLARAGLAVDGGDVIRFVNDQPLPHATAAFTRLLETLTHSETPPS